MRRRYDHIDLLEKKRGRRLILDELFDLSLSQTSRDLTK
jgi:hypothetical protein